MKTYIKNVAVLDMRKATPERVDQIAGIGNTALILVSAETAPLVSRLNIGNTAAVVEVPEGAELVMYNGNATVANLKDTSLVFLMANGNLSIGDQVTPEEIRGAVTGGIVNGNLNAKESQVGALVAAGIHVNGNLNVYPDDVRLRDTDEPLTAHEAMGADAPLYLTRRVVIEPGAAAAFAEKGMLLYGRRGAIIPAQESQAFYRVWKGKGKVLQIPEGFSLMDGTQDIRRAKALLLRGKRFIIGDLFLHEDVDMQSLQALESLVVTGNLFLPEALLAPMLDRLHEEPELVPYAGALMRLDGEMTLTPGALPDGPAALYVDGQITFSDAFTPEMLRGGVTLLYNNGVVRLSEAQRAALLPVLLGDGVADILPGQAEADEDDSCEIPEGCNVIANAAQFIL